VKSPNRRRFLRAAGVGTAAALLPGGTAAAAERPFEGKRASGKQTGGKRAGALAVRSVRPAEEVTERWRHYGDTSGRYGWAGSDGTFSTTLPGGAVAWMFNDTFLGPVDADESLPRTSAFIHNSIVVDDGRRLTTVIGGGRGRPESLVGPTPSPPVPDASAASPYWYWNNDGIVDGGRLRLFEAKIVPTDAEPPWNFAGTGEMFIASFSLPHLRLESVTPTYGGDGFNWGDQLVRIGEWVYVYGDKGGLRLARARAGRLVRQEWQFWTGAGWSPHQEDSTVILDGVGLGGVTPMMGRFVVTHTPGLLDPTVYAYEGPTPAGPFTPLGAVYTPPESSQGLYTYNLAAHPELSRSPNRLVVSYNVNSVRLQDLYDDINNNRPRFVEIEFGSA
jgi:hypothetical protein